MRFTSSVIVIAILEATQTWSASDSDSLDPVDSQGFPSVRNDDPSMRESTETDMADGVKHMESESHPPTILDSNDPGAVSHDIGIIKPVVHASDSPIESAKARDDFAAEDERMDAEGVTDPENATDEEDANDTSAGAVKQLLNHLFGEAIDAFSTSESLSKMSGTMTIDCSSTADDSDATFNVVTTLCPFLRSNGPCGRIRHPSYEIEDESAVCSSQCRPHINALIQALPNRGSLSHKNEGIIFRDVVNSILHQYCSICRTGCVL